MRPDLETNSIVVITYGHNKVLDKPFERIAQFKYYNLFGRPVCCPVGEPDTQSSFALDLSTATIREATEEDKENIQYE